jgi:hypothetical protein
MARVPHTAQINLCFCEPVRELSDFDVGLCAAYFLRESFYLFI